MFKFWHLGGNRLLLLTKNALMKRCQKIWAGPPLIWTKSKRPAVSPRETVLNDSMIPVMLNLYIDVRTSIIECFSSLEVLKSDGSFFEPFNHYSWRICSDVFLPSVHPADNETKTTFWNASEFFCTTDLSSTRNGAKMFMCFILQF